MPPTTNPTTPLSLQSLVIVSGRRTWTTCKTTSHNHPRQGPGVTRCLSPVLCTHPSIHARSPAPTPSFTARSSLVARRSSPTGPAGLTASSIHLSYPPAPSLISSVHLHPSASIHPIRPSCIDARTSPRHVECVVRQQRYPSTLPNISKRVLYLFTSLTPHPPPSILVASPVRHDNYGPAQGF